MVTAAELVVVVLELVEVELLEVDELLVVDEQTDGVGVYEVAYTSR